METIRITALHLNHGGVEKVICAMANLFVCMGHPTEILCTYQLCEPVYEIDERVKITYLTQLKPNRAQIKEAIRSKNPVQILKEGFSAINILHKKKSTMKKAIKEIDSGIIISTRNETSTLLSKYGHEAVFKIAQLHHDHAFNDSLIKDFRKNYKNIDELLLLNDTLTNEVKEIMKGYNDYTRCSTLPNFIENETLSAFPNKKNQLISIGRLHSDKGFDRLLEIWMELSKSLVDYELLILGDGELRDSLEALASKLGVSDSVIFTGMVEHETTITLLKESKMYLMTSITEALPLVLLEAMSQATVPVAFDVRVGPKAIISDHNDGFLVDSDDQKRYVEIVLEYIKSYTTGNRYEINALEKAKLYSKQEIARLWERALDRNL